MASHNPSGKPDMMPFPGVHSVRREEASRKCKAISVAHLNNTAELLLGLTRKLQPSTEYYFIVGRVNH